MPSHVFKVYEVDRSYYYSDAQSPILSQDQLTITDGDNQLDKNLSSDSGRDQSFDFASESGVSSYKVQYLDYAQVDGGGPEYELYAMKVQFDDNSTKYYVMSKDPGFDPNVGADLKVTSFSTFTNTDYGDIGAVICFTPGTTILCEHGEVPVEKLRIGDRVQTVDSGFQPVQWVGSRHLDARTLVNAQHLKPVVMGAGTFGNHGPMVVSPQHCFETSNGILAETGLPKNTLIRAKHVAEYFPEAARFWQDARHVNYVHFLLPDHGLVFADGSVSESLFPGPMAFEGVSREDRQEIETLFPELSEGPLMKQSRTPVRPVLLRRDIREMTGRKGPSHTDQTISRFEETRGKRRA